MVELSQGKLIPYLGNYGYFREKKLSQKKKDEFNKVDKTSNKVVNDSKDNSKSIINKSNSKRIKELEARIEEYENLIARKGIEINMNATDYIKLNDLYNEKVELENQRDKLLEEWIMLYE
ncbi:hypothetical protein CULT_2180003 [[Clostridium] ultunense Esp]|uniref:ABC transporter Uup C-terminal domain-containing protein n=1 Tax=[Clostridium] ultunense Esp TaxID=1288971 RepID=M1Z9U6_9FIRM|nr:hypothetical protein [Schnuerera ultunensis]CCQ94956.1 hypothetical protein CULT_2180003 [[Clostridium] ultunense Esp]SHD76803.1 conserved protein of unknown function [[Clostridium] ultunense Esp]